MGGGGGATGFCTGGGATTAAFSTGTAEGGATGALGAITVGFSCTGGVASGLTGGLGMIGGGAGAMIIGRGAIGRSFCSSRSLSWRATSPGLCTLEKSIFGLISAEADRSEADAVEDFPEKCFLIFSARSSSIELECVRLSVTPSSGNESRIAFAFTSSSLASSLILIRSAFPPGCALSDHISLIHPSV